MPLGRPLGAKLFLEGIEVPFIGATITSSVGQASIAYVDVVPHKSIMNIKPRTRVDIFVRNYQDEGPKCKFPYVLAWQGEVFGVNFGKTPSSRTMSLSCIDLTSYWDCVLCYYFNAKQSMGSGGLQKGGQYNQVIEAKILNEKVINTSIAESSFFKQAIEPFIGKPGKDFLDGIIAVYESIGYTNDFFKTGNYRLRISDQIAFHSSKALYELLKQDEAYKWFIGMADRQSGFSSLRQVMETLLGLIFHDCVTVPFPAAVKRDAQFSLETYNEAPRKGVKSPDNTKRTVGSIVFKPNLYMLPPPMCNVFFPEEYSSFQFSRNFFKEPTRLTYMPELPARLGQGSAMVSLAHIHEPPSFHYYMKGSGDYKNYQGIDSFQVPKTGSGSDPGHAEDPDKDEYHKKLNSGKKREYNFMTNEEFIKGIWHARESMMPATTQFRESLDLDTPSKQAFTKRVARYLFYKKRFQDRSLQITSHLKLSVVPGFPVLVMDDSDADQNIIAYCSSVTHRIYATEGGYTNTQLSYARYVAEEDASSNHGTSYLIPPWMDSSIFGTMKVPDITVTDSNKEEVAKLGIQGVFPPKLSEFYKTLLGDRGSQSLSSIGDDGTLLTAVRKLKSEYRKKKAKGASQVQAYIAHTTARSYVRIKDFYEFLGATTKDSADAVDAGKWNQFDGAVFTRSGKPDERPLKLKRDVIKKYRDILKESRGFRG